MILSDSEITHWASNGGVSLFDQANVNPASLDLRLGDTISIPRWWWRPGLRRLAWIALGRPSITERPELFWRPPVKFDAFTLWPGQFVLCHSVEATQIPADVVGLLFSKSSSGRVGLEHLHAGYGDPGFGLGEPSQWTFELYNVAPWPLPLKMGQRVTQLVLVRMASEPERLYGETGRYQGQRGPTAARRDLGEVKARL